MLNMWVNIKCFKNILKFCKSQLSKAIITSCCWLYIHICMYMVNIRAIAQRAEGGVSEIIASQ